MGTWSRKRLNELHGSCSVPNCGAFERELEVDSLGSSHAKVLTFPLNPPLENGDLESQATK